MDINYDLLEIPHLAPVKTLNNKAKGSYLGTVELTLHKIPKKQKYIYCTNNLKKHTYNCPYCQENIEKIVKKYHYTTDLEVYDLGYDLFKLGGDYKLNIMANYNIPQCHLPYSITALNELTELSTMSLLHVREAAIYFNANLANFKMAC